MKRLILALTTLVLLAPADAFARGEFDPTTEFEQHKWIPIHLGPLDLSITKAVVYLMIGTVGTILVGLGGAGWHEDTLTHLIRSFTTPLMSKFTSQKFGFFVAQLNHDDLAFFADLMQSGKVTPVIDKTYKSLGEVQDALEYLEGGHARGKVVIAVE